MNERNIIRSLNLTGAEVLTLEKAADRLEFEALPVMSAGAVKCFEVNDGGDCDCNFGGYSDNHNCDGYCQMYVCATNGFPEEPDPCSCVAPSGYQLPDA